MKFNSVIIWLILAVVVPIGFCHAQQTSSIPNIIPPSPSAQAFQRYGKYPVSHTTGVPDISIPIYEIESGELSLPITMKYHAAGFRPSDRDGILGLYWTLHTGGIISRDIRGIPDDYGPDGYLLTSKKYNTTDLLGMYKMDVYDYLFNIENRGQDSEYDIFSYSASGTSGTFSLIGTNSGGTRTATAILANEKKLEQIYCYLEGNTTIQAFDVTREDGIRYHYGKSLTDGANATERTGSFSGVTQSNTSWLLTEIISPDLTDTIRFTYNDHVYQTYTLPSYNTSVRTDFLLYNSCIPGYQPISFEQSTSSNPIFNYYYEKTIDKILFKNGFLKFNYSTANKLTSITIFNRQDQQIRAIDFTLSAYQSHPGYAYNKLDAVTLNSGEVYHFEYNNEPLAVGGDLSEDWWGFYNGSYYPSAMTPPMTMPFTGQNFGYSNVSRESNNHMKNLILNKIIYPTGGSTTFNFEMNQYRSVVDGLIKNAGGLRISSIENNNAAGNITREVYKYGQNEDGAGKVVIEPIFENLVSRVESYDWGSTSFLTCPNNTLIQYFSSHGLHTNITNYLAKQTNFSSSVHYKEVAKYQVNVLDIMENAGKTIYRYNDPLFTVTPSSVGSYEYFNSAGPTIAQPLMPAAEEGIYPAEYYSQLLETEYFKKQGNSYLPVRKEVNIYGSGEAMPDLTNLRLHHYSRHSRTYPSGSGSSYERDMVQDYPFLVTTPGFSIPHDPPIVYKAYTIYNKSIRLASKRVEEYEGGQTMVTTEDYSYATSHGLPILVVKTGSNGRIYNSSYDRPKDLVNSITNPEFKEAVDTMIRRNMIAQPLSHVESVIDMNMENRIQAHTDLKTTYKVWDASKRLVKPKEITKILMGDAPVEKVIFSGYDNEGNMLQVTKEHDLTTSYIWDYLEQFPIAKVTNSNQADIAYTSFEAYGTGNWSFPGAVLTVAGGVTGDRAYNIGTGSMSKSNLSSSTEYIVSYWSNTGPLTVTGNTGIPVTGPSYGGWSYFEHRAKNVSTVTISGSGQIDEVRLYPAKAQMTTFTYAPLVGVTSECDMNNRIIYYEYDANQRLRYVRDAQRNVLKVIDYQYDANYQQ
ncbi:hypothetical protein [Chitinophaga niabensis]|uniref:YD repeat-containing protein n=1 Tax=Chitinophaga niabensis TaxID=536979 RepID=A0A1N6GP15_9BACT|nr:hypothetical protein [Chitinophaga niabensis]SIO09215.1 hypothetical protein SAMN04488055_2883 [Chitinophaga niabensis]